MVTLFNLHDIISILKTSETVANIENIHIDEIAQRGFYKIRCRLIPSKYNLEMKFIKTREEFTYSYQLFTTTAIARWDNEPHYPNIKTFPHHYHGIDGNISESDLAGDPQNDLKCVLKAITKLLVQGGEGTGQVLVGTPEHHQSSCLTPISATGN